MGKITSADCKQLIVDNLNYNFTQLDNLFTEPFDEMTKKYMLNPKNWKRMDKHSNQKDSYYSLTVFDLPSKQLITLKEKDIACYRTFYFYNDNVEIDPGDVRYLVIETKQGNIYFGEYCGD